MKISEAMLYCIREAGGEIEFMQFDRWIAQLSKAGYLKFEKRGEEQEAQFYYKLTPKAEELLRRKGL